MNDLPQEELLSAYLDGELTAAQRADVERRLAADPAAQQLLDELRALSSTLQSLPQERLRENLSRKVLRAAERRMLAEGDRGEQESTPTPLDRTIPRRFLNRRTLVWLSLTAAIAVMITINERQQAVRHAPDAGREVALAPAKPEDRVAAEVGRPYSIRARDKDDYSLKGAEALAKDGSTAGAASSPVSLAETPAAAPPASEEKRLAGRSEVAHIGKAAPAKRAKKTGEAEQAEKEPGADQRMMVVRCDISLNAARQGTLEKLLDANGVAWRQGRDGNLLANARQEEAKQDRVGAYMDSVRSNVMPEPALIYLHADATPAQLAATLTSLRSHTEAFGSVSVQPARDERSRVLVRQFAAGDRAAGKLGAADVNSAYSAKAPSRAATKTVKAEAERHDRPAPYGSTPSSKLEFQQKVHVAGPSAGRGTVGQLDMTVREGAWQSQALARSPPRQQVLFVLRVVGGDRPPVAAKAKTRMEPDTAKPAAAATPPAAEAAQPK
jgi:anti-sigma factor RsiW